MAAGPPTRTERAVFIAAVGLVLLYAALRAVTVPITHDEAMTFFTYVETGDLLPFLSHWDAGNHVLCTALGWVGHTLFGLHAWALRLPSVLAFLLYAGYAWRWGLRVSDRLVRHCLWAALLLTPYLLEFFSLFRGYGLAMAFLSMALYHGCAFLQERRTGSLAWTMLALFLASFSSLSLVTLWGFLLFVLLVTILYPRRRHVWRQLVVWAVGGAGFLFTAYYLAELATRGALYYGVRTGILRGTVASLLEALFGTRAAWAIAVVVLVFCCGAVAGWRTWRRKDRSFGATAVQLCLGLLLADVVARIMLFRLWGTLFPEDRTALQWVLLLLLGCAFAVDREAVPSPRWHWSATLLLLFPLRTLTTMDLTHAVQWPAESIPDDILRAAAARQERAGRLLTIGAYHQLPPCWSFGVRASGLPLGIADPVDFPNGGTDLLLLDPQRTRPPAGYRPVMQGPSGHVELLERTVALQRTLVLDSVLMGASSDAEFRELWHPAIEQVRDRAFLLELDLAITSPKAPLPMDLVCEVDADGDGRQYRSMLLQFAGGRWQGDTLRVVRRFSRIAPDARKAVLYFWDHERWPYAYAGRMRVWRLVDE